jgi:hypothetical protein
MLMVMNLAGLQFLVVILTMVMILTGLQFLVNMIIRHRHITFQGTILGTFFRKMINSSTMCLSAKYIK